MKPVLDLLDRRDKAMTKAEQAISKAWPERNSGEFVFEMNEVILISESLSASVANNTYSLVFKYY